MKVNDALEKFEVLKTVNENIELTYHKSKGSMFTDSRDFLNARYRAITDTDATVFNYSVVNKCCPEVSKTVRAFQHVILVLFIY